MKTAEEFATDLCGEPGEVIGVWHIVKDAVTARDSEHAAQLAAARREAHEAGAEAMKEKILNRVAFRAEKWQQGAYTQRAAAADLLADDIRALSAPPAAPGEPPACTCNEKGAKDA